MAKITSYEFTFEIFKKHYCPYCGIRLERKQKNNILHKGDKGFTKNHLGVGYNPFVNENRIITYYFVCYRCNKKYNQHGIQPCHILHHGNETFLHYSIHILQMLYGENHKL